MKKYLSWFLVVLMASLTSCGDDNTPDTDVDNFDRQAMLVNWADNIILPAYTEYVSDVSALSEQAVSFTETPDIESLTDLRRVWHTAYSSWQSVSMFEIGPAESVTLRDFSNIFPTDVAMIEAHVADGDYNLQLPSTRVAQGFPAIDYLLFGSASTDEEIVARFVQESSMSQYLVDIAARLALLAQNVNNEWNNGYRDTFVSNSGSSASSSVNKLTNDFMFYYEKALRAGKIGIPAGVFSTTPLSDRVEGLYSREYTKNLFIDALEAAQDFFNGKHFNSNTRGESLKSYLDFLNATSNGESLSDQINNQFDAALAQGSTLQNDLFQEVESNNSVMLRTYDELQKNVILMKVDMFQALSITVDFVDADGD